MIQALGKSLDKIGSKLHVAVGAPEQVWRGVSWVRFCEFGSWLGIEIAIELP